MTIALLFLLCLLVPFIMVLLFRRTKLPLLGLTYLATVIIIVASPFAIVRIENYFNPPQQALKCDNDQTEIILIILILNFYSLIYKKLKTDKINMIIIL